MTTNPGQSVRPAKRAVDGPVVIDRRALGAVADADDAEFTAGGGKVTYVRARARALGRALGTHGHVALLRRTAVGPFAAESAVGIDELQRLARASHDGVVGA